MTERVLGPTASRRRKRLLVLPFVALAALLLAIGATALNPPLSNFEIDGDPTTGVSVGGSGGTTLPGVDWSKDGTNSGQDCNPAAGQPAGDAAGDVAPCPAALVFNSSLPVDGNPASGTNPTDNQLEAGHATFFRDDLKVDPGGDDTTFTNGDKENECVEVSKGVCQVFTEGSDLTSKTPYSIVEGSVPPNKDDLFDIYTYTKIVGSQADVVLGAIRTNSNGDSHIDYELNKRGWEACVVPPGNASTLCPRRTEGDLLIAYDISNTTPTEVRFFRWELPGGIDAGIINGVNRHGTGQTQTLGCDGQFNDSPAVKSCPWEEINLPASAVVSVLNTNGGITAPVWGSRTPNGVATNTLEQFAFFETFLDFDELGLGPGCPGFAFASAKTRASTSIDAAMHDLAGPFPIDLNTCAKITIVKNTEPDGDQNFDYTTTGGLSPSTFSLDDDSDPALSNTRVYANLNPGDYTVTETLPVAGYALTDLTCVVDVTNPSDPTTASPSGGSATPTSTIHLGNNGEVTCTYTNTRQLGAIKITKTAKNKTLTPPASGDPPHAGVSFTITGAGGPYSLTTDTNGVACQGNLTFGSYQVTETVPTGYQADSTNPQAVTVNTNSTCGDGNEATATFHNTPLTTVTVDTTSLAGPGVTTSTVQCTDEGSASSTPHTTGSYVPGTVVCTIVIDP